MTEIDPNAPMHGVVTLTGSNGKDLKFFVTNDRTKWRALTLATKEPVTFDWLSTLTPDDVLIDVGANVGIYSLYAAVVRGCRVYAFEPEALNYARLTDNIALNHADDRVRAFALALSDTTGFGTLHLALRDIGGSCHSLNAEVGPFLEERPSAFVQGVAHARLDQFCFVQGIRPTHVKIDVDGFEYLVVRGMGNLPSVRSVIIETNHAIPEHRRMTEQMIEMGFRYDPEQVERARRTSGPFKGVAEVVYNRVAS